MVVFRKCIMFVITYTLYSNLQGLEGELAGSEDHVKKLVQDGKDLYHRHHQHHQHHPEQPHSGLADSVKQQQTGLEKDWLDTKARAAQKAEWLQVRTIIMDGLLNL